MSLVLVQQTPSGIVLASDSRFILNYPEHFEPRKKIEDNGFKLFNLYQFAAIGITGQIATEDGNFSKRLKLMERLTRNPKRLPINSHLQAGLEFKKELRLCAEAAFNSSKIPEFEVVVSAYLFQRGDMVPSIWKSRSPEFEMDRLYLRDAIGSIGDDEYIDEACEAAKRNIPNYVPKSSNQRTIDYLLEVFKAVNAISFKQNRLHPTIGGAIDVLLLRPDKDPKWISRKDVNGRTFKDKFYLNCRTRAKDSV